MIKLEATLDLLVPRAFAIVKETATRFKENSVLEVTARQFEQDCCHKEVNYHGMIRLSGAISGLPVVIEITWDTDSL